MLFEQAQAGADHLARGGEAAGGDLRLDEAEEVGAEDDGGVLAHGDRVYQKMVAAERWTRSRVSVSAETVRFDVETMWVGPPDRRVIGVPLAWFPRLLRADPAARAAVEISPLGLHWEALDEYVSVAGLLAGRGDRGRVSGEAA